MDSMIFNNIVLQLIVLGAFFLLFVLIPSFCMGLKLTYKDLIHNILSAVTVGFFFMIIIVFIIVALNSAIANMKFITAPMNLINPISLLVAIILSVIVLPWVFYYKRQREYVHQFTEYLYFIIKKIYKPKLIFNNYLDTKKKQIITFILDIFKNPLKTIAFLIGTGWGAFVRCNNAVTQNFFGTSDLYVHTEWVAQMVGGNIFANGVYPFGMHNIVLAMNQLFGINLPLLMRFLGGIFGILILLSLYLLLTRLFKSDFAVAVGYIFYVASKYIGPMGYERQSLALPQEVGMIFLCLCGVFFVDYLREKKMKDLVLLVMAFSLTISCHFYITIFALILLFCIFLVHIKYIIREKIFLRLVIALVISSVSAALPLVLFNLSGIRWEPSMEWAASIMKKTEEEEPKEEELSDELAAEPESAHAALASPEEKIRRSPIETVMHVSEAFGANIGNNPPLQQKIFIVYSCLTLILLFYALIFLLIKKQQEYAKFLVAACFYCGTLVILVFAQILGLFSLFQISRLFIFYAYSMGILVGGVAEILVTPFTYVKFLRKPGAVLAFLATGLYVWNFSQIGMQMPGSTVQVQYDGAIAAYYKIVNNFEDLKWTVITTVDELCMVRNLGWHYEVCTLVYELADQTYGKKITIPGNDLFFFIEKRPIRPYRIRWNDMEGGYKFEPEEPVSMEYASKSIMDIKDTLELKSEIYTNYEYRKVVMSKAYYWMQEYMKYFPSEISVFYEDDDFIAYHLRQQDPYALNNLFIDYGFNE